MNNCGSCLFWIFTQTGNDDDGDWGQCTYPYSNKCDRITQEIDTCPYRKDKKMNEGLKNDDEKLRLDLMPIYALEGLAEILTHGAKKYAPYNWTKGIKWSRLYAATLRHLFAMWAGEDIDPDSNLPHIDHALCNIAFLSTYAKHNKYVKFDDRPVKEFEDEL